jgi:hypothetical protein
MTFGAVDRRGGALLFALVVVVMVTGATLALLRITQSTTARQGHSVDDKRAFYLAEAGLSEAYFGVTSGKTGQLGSAAAPTRVGDGFAWVDAAERTDGLITLTSTALCSSGRATLQLTVRPVEEPPGVFADEGISVSAPFLVDGYDPELGSYAEQLLPGTITVDRSYRFLHDDPVNRILFYNQLFYRYSAVSGDTYTFDHVLDHSVTELPGVEWDDFIDDEWREVSTVTT